MAKPGKRSPGRKPGVKTNDVAEDLIGDNPLETEDDWRRLSSRLVQLLAAGQLSVDRAHGLQQLARLGLAALRQDAERRRVEELRAILERAERLHAEGIRHEQRVRQHREDPLAGRWDLEEWRRALLDVGRAPGVRRVDGGAEPHGDPDGEE